MAAKMIPQTAAIIRWADADADAEDPDADAEVPDVVWLREPCVSASRVAIASRVAMIKQYAICNTQYTIKIV